jgi:glutathione S-transferase
MGRTHLLEALAYISTEVHKSFKPFFSGAGEEAKAKAREIVATKLRYLDETMVGDYLLGPQLSVADCYLFVMLLWAGKQGIDLPSELAALKDRMMARESVRKAMTHEGLL